MWPLRWGSGWLVALAALGGLAVLVLLLGVRMLALREGPETFAKAWQEHRAACLQLPKDK